MVEAKDKGETRGEWRMSEKHPVINVNGKDRVTRVGDPPKPSTSPVAILNP